MQIARTLEHYWMPFTDNARFKVSPKFIVSAKDMYYTTSDGRQVLDGSATLWCVNAGHCRPRIVEAIRRQGGARFRGTVLHRASARVRARGADRRARAARPFAGLLHQLGLRGGGHGPQDRGRLPFGADGEKVRT